jgi:exopolysaccharide production protein ExoZ
MAFQQHIKVIDTMRGIAALAVTLCHVGGACFESFSKIGYIFSYGQLGVHVFFVISGFVMPWSLDKIGYSIRDFGKFIARRSLRIDPPYYITIILYIGITFLLTLRPQYAGLPFHFELNRLLLHLGYLIPLSDYTWYTNIFWTLSVEFQYYIIIGCLFPLIRKHTSALITFLILIALFPIFITIPKSDLFIFEYQGLFALGILGWASKKKILNENICHILAGVEFLLICQYLHIPAAIAGIISYMLIIGVHRSIEKIQWLGQISYSLYLTHPIILIATGGIIRRTPETVEFRTLIFIVLISMALVFAKLFWLYIEVPSQALAKKWFPHKITQ